MVKLHLGCGKNKFRGYWNIDSFGSPDKYGDITKLDYPENSVDEILAVHVFEHLFPWRAEEILKGWYRILKPGGKLILEMPDLVKILEHFAPSKRMTVGDGIDFLTDPDSKIPPTELNLTLTMFPLYGGTKEENIESLHKWCWTYQTIALPLASVGFKQIAEKPALYHWPNRDFRVEAVK